MRYLLNLAFILSFTALLGVASVANAQAVNYIDESGNIHFADSVDQVPLAYRDQVVKKKPVILTKEQYKQAKKDFHHQQVEALRKQKQDEKVAQKLARDKAKLEEKQRKEEESKSKKEDRALFGKGGDGQAPDKTTLKKKSTRYDPLSAKVRKYGQENMPSS